MIRINVLSSVSLNKEAMFMNFMSIEEFTNESNMKIIKKTDMNLISMPKKRGSYQFS